MPSLTVTRLLQQLLLTICDDDDVTSLGGVALSSPTLYQLVAVTGQVSTCIVGEHGNFPHGHGNSPQTFVLIRDTVIGQPSQLGVQWWKLKLIWKGLFTIAQVRRLT